MTTNIGLEFNKRVYRNLKNDPLLNVPYRDDNMQLYELLIKTKLSDLQPEQLDLSNMIGNGFESFCLTTAGQGFLIGTGNEHGTGVKVKQNKTLNDKEVIDTIESHEFKMGFHFDHSTGIPVITGHNLKGRIRSFFPIAYKGGDKRNAIEKRFLDDFIDCFKNDLSFNLAGWDIAKIKKLQDVIFEGGSEKENKTNPIKQDVFFGAFPSKSKSPEFQYYIPKKYTYPNKQGITINKYDKEESVKIPQGTFLFDDTLANHPHPLKDPNPIRFLKILPGIEITFQFRLNDEGGLTGKQKATLFKYLLRKYGAGAKTSSGYGQFEKEVILTDNTNFPSFDNFNPINLDEKKKGEADTLVLPEDPSWPELKNLVVGSKIIGTVVEFNSGNAKIKLHVKGLKNLIGLQGKFELNSVLSLKITETLGSIKKGNFSINKVVILKS